MVKSTGMERINMLMNDSKPITWLLGLLLTVVVAGCGSGGGGTTAQPGTLGVSLTDAPACGFDEVNVTVSKVRVHQTDTDNVNAAGWSDIVLDPPKRINLLEYNDPTKNNGALLPLGDISLPSGHYTQVRLVLVPNNGSIPPNNSVVLSDTKEEKPLDTPSAVQSGIKLVHEFDVPSGQRVDLLLDFDACKSIVKTGSGKYKLKPVIKVIPFVLNGIEGFIDTALLGNSVVVTAQVNGEVVRATVPNTQTGKFFLARLPGYPAPADYPAYYDVVITAKNSPTNTCCATAVISGVPVFSSTSITPISIQAQPFQLQPSAFHTIGDAVTLINPPPLPAVDDRDDATVNVAAKQALSGGPTVTVRSQVATVNDGLDPVGDFGYGLALPTAAPSLASYGALPITPDATGQAANAGVYSIYGSAQTPTVVYATQTPAPSTVNIAAGDNLDQDFTLAP